jgi:hypothetical protein
MRILRAVDRAREHLPLQAVLRFLRVSPGRFHACAWRIPISLAFPGFRQIVRIVPCATWPSCFSTSWRLSPS